MGSRGANPFWFHVLSSTLSHLIALALALLVYLLFLLWRDYVALLLSSFLLAQALHRLRARLVTRIRALRDPTQPPLLRVQTLPHGFFLTEKCIILLSDSQRKVAKSYQTVAKFGAKFARKMHLVVWKWPQSEQFEAKNHFWPQMDTFGAISTPLGAFF